MKGGIEFFGQHKLDYVHDKSKTEIGPSYSLSVETLTPIFEEFEAGLGVTYQFSRRQNFEFDTGKFHFVPIYGIIKIKNYRLSITTLNIIANVGYNLFYSDNIYSAGSDLKGGLYVGLGLRIDIIDRFFIETMYKENYGNAYISKIGIDIKYSYLSIAVGTSL